ncbi:MAG: OmpA family protein [Bacteroidetes bacterium]|nr:OmpA family protein [Bacteroidota bacterium]
MLKKNIFIILSILFASIINAQNFSTKSKKAIKYYKSAIANYDNNKTDIAINDLKRAIKKDNNFIEAYLLKGDIYKIRKEYKNEINTYFEVINIDENFFPYIYYNLASTELLIGEYEAAKSHFKQFLEKKYVRKDIIDIAEQKLKQCDFAIEQMKNPVKFNPVDLGPNINSIYDDYWPALTVDGKTLITTVLIPKEEAYKTQYDSTQEDFYVSYLKNKKWTKAVKLSSIINTPFNEGALSISSDGGYCFFTACGRSNGYGLCDIYMAKNENGKWTRPVNVGRPVNSKYSEKQPSISSDGKTLYFSSNRPGGKGSMDLWVSTYENARWSEPKNLGDSINTFNSEISPFIHHDNQTLYFASNGHLGMGGYDMFLSRKNSVENWSRPENLGYPINTFGEEFGMIINSDANRALFSSDRKKTTGRDIYEFTLPEKIKPVSVNYVNGFVYDAKTNIKLEAKIELVDIETNKIITKKTSDKTSGKYLVCLPTNKNYALEVDKKGYLFFSENFSLKNNNDSLNPYLINIPLYPINIGEKIILKNIFFTLNSFELKKESYFELSKIIQLMNNNPDMKAEIAGHTDSIGTNEYNIELSQNRAKSVYNYLIQNSNLKSRLSYKGYGSSMPIATNNTILGRSKNRRTEFIIITK